MSDPGNGAQVRLVAHQLFQEWKAEQGKQRASWPAWVGLVAGAASLIFSAGGLRSEQATANMRIEKLETRADAHDRMAAQVNDRLARMETKLDMALEKRR